MKNTLHYALILDQSGSMQDLKGVTISSFNEQIDSILNLKKKNPESDVKITFCVFNEEVELRSVANDIDHVEKLDNHNYQPNSCTALYDAMGITLLRMQELVKSGDKVFVAVFTDGLENASRNYTSADIVHKLEEAKSKAWNIKFYCNVHDMDFFRDKLRLEENDLQGITLNDYGIRYMRKSIDSMLCDLITGEK